MGFKSMKSRVSVGALALAGFALAAITPAGAQSGEYQQQLTDQLSAARTAYANEGYTVYGGPFYGGLAEDESMSFVVTLIGGKTYYIGGVCDSDCSDLDLEVSDARGATIGEDAADDDVPIVEVAPRVTGPVTVSVNMFKCSTAPCFVAVEVYAK